MCIFAEIIPHMRTILQFLLGTMTCMLSAALAPGAARAQNALPSASPQMWVTEADGSETDMTSFDGSAPMKARFTANPTDVGEYLPRYEWRFLRQNEETPFLVRYDEDTEYTFTESGAFTVQLYITYTLRGDTVDYAMDTPFTISISESKLEFPNAFTPNGDGVNDILRAKEGYQSIVSFKASIYSRWGRQLYSWDDLEGGWDGKSGGSDVPDGAYYLEVNARGADGRHYHIKKVVNLLRGYTENGGGSAAP